jgi:hypothetical protein
VTVLAFLRPRKWRIKDALRSLGRRGATAPANEGWAMNLRYFGQLACEAGVRGRDKVWGAILGIGAVGVIFYISLTSG